MAGFFAPDGSIAVNGGVPAVGRDAIAELVQGFYDAFPDTVVIMDHVRGAADKAIYSWTYEGTNTGPEGTGNAVASTAGRHGPSTPQTSYRHLSALLTPSNTKDNSPREFDRLQGTTWRIPPRVGW